MDLVVEKATEVGVTRIVPLLSDRGIVKPRDAKVGRWRRVAEAAARQSLRLAVPEVAEPLGFSEAVRGDYQRAEALFEESVAIGRESNDAPGVATSLMCLGAVATRQGDHGRARALLEESLMLNMELGLRVNIAECLEILSGMAGALGDAARAARLWGAADALREAIGAPWLPLERRLYEPHLAAIRSRSDQAVWAGAWEEGRAMTMEDAVGYALEEE
jgi:non-specific serine/threonine protein kinase